MRRTLTQGERVLARSVFHDRIDLDRVTLRPSRWFPFQPRHVAMAPMGHIHFHPDSPLWSADYSREDWPLQGLFIHELVHVWQAQRGMLLPFVRLPFSRYGYRLVSGRPLKAYGVEQQAEIVRHAFLIRAGVPIPEARNEALYEAILAQAFRPPTGLLLPPAPGE